MSVTAPKVAAALAKAPTGLHPTIKTLLKIPPHLSPVNNQTAFNALSPNDKIKVTLAAPHVLAAGGGTSSSASNPVGAVPVAGPGMGAPSNPGTFNVSPNNPEYEGYENADMLNPASALKRKPWPVHILPAVATTDANGNATLTWTPQEDFQPFLLTFPSTITTQGYVTQIAVGTRMVNIASGKMPIECFGEKNDARRLDFPFAKATQQIVANVVSGPATTTIYGVLLGYAVGSAAQYPVSQARMGLLPLGTTSIASGATATVSVIPQERCKIRRLCLNSQAAQFGSVIITGFQIGTLLETGQVANFPASIFSDLAIDDWVDFDVCNQNSTIAINLSNVGTSTVAAVFEGFAVCDVWYANEVQQAA